QKDTFDRLNNAGCSVDAHVGSDLDHDGCTYDEETGPDEGLGGQRDPDNRWDFYDIDGNRTVDLFGDIFGVAFAFGQELGGPDYSPEKDRSLPPTAKVEPDPAKRQPWDMRVPDGVIDLFVDVFGVALQFGHECT
ncbi:MAG: flexitail domain-containing putative surface protein, partial [Dehalococcoidia bacterium]|nr:flexitail domain-containing putative surface protein [Dehalococcoidia bacterium]